MGMLLVCISISCSKKNKTAEDRSFKINLNYMGSVSFSSSMQVKIKFYLDNKNCNISEISQNDVANIITKIDGLPTSINIADQSPNIDEFTFEILDKSSLDSKYTVVESQVPFKIEGGQEINIQLAEVIKESSFSKDDRRVYFRGRTISLANPATFSLLDERPSTRSLLAKDNENIYFKNTRLAGDFVDPKSFIRLGYHYAKDQNQVYYFNYKNIISMDANPGTFEVLNDHFDEDLSFAADSQKFFFKDGLIESFSPENVSILDGGYYKNDTMVGFADTIIFEAVAESFTTSNCRDIKKDVFTGAADETVNNGCFVSDTEVIDSFLCDGQDVNGRYQGAEKIL